MPRAPQTDATDPNPDSPEIEVLDAVPADGAEAKEEGDDTVEQEAPRPHAPSLVDILRARVQEKEDQLHSYIAAYKQAKEEMAKVQERMSRDRDKEVARAKMNAARDLLDVLDNLDRTVQGATTDRAVGALAEGVVMVRNQFVSVLEGFGVERMSALGTDFDPKLHEAVGMVPALPGHRDQEILFVQRAGYLFDGQLLRAAQVIVAAAS